ncbi:hypothetical protein ES332_A04G175600v1 [Gossypium tomentosum]|uniref:WLM domain-containing protein n=1 Tax=Gossypium tomentosum TaxID=34277 RepID=A0A5D2R3I5_GOSTO|nr:hypothetical protein ES332_A04G175600v1 [Gossypium tomentosum]
MRKHKWRVKLLSEFCPNNPALLGLNVGAGIHVKLRLRRPNWDWDFHPFDQVLDTMLHELCHNAHGPHNASFYKLWDELRKILACEDQIIKKALLGVTGGSQDVPIYGFTIKHYLCGKGRAYSTIRDALSPIQAVAMAAERRLQDDIWCGSHCSDITGDEESYADTLQDHLDLDQGGERLSINDVSSRHAFGGTSLKQSHGQDKPESSFVDLTTPPVSRSSINEGAKSPKRSCKSNNLIPHQSSSNECQSCTLLNPPLAPICKLCCMERPRDIGTKYKFWSCKFCTLENSVKLDKCSACDQWRNSLSDEGRIWVESHFGAN